MQICSSSDDMSALAKREALQQLVEASMVNDISVWTKVTSIFCFADGDHSVHSIFQVLSLLSYLLSLPVMLMYFNFISMQ